MRLRSCSLWRVAVGPAGVSRALHACHPGRSPPQHSTAQHNMVQRRPAHQPSWSPNRLFSARTLPLSRWSAHNRIKSTCCWPNEIPATDLGAAAQVWLAGRQAKPHTILRAVASFMEQAHGQMHAACA